MDLGHGAAALPLGPEATPHDHVVLFYSDDAELVAKVGRDLGEAVGAGVVVVALATEAHLRAIAVEMGRAGINVEKARDDGSFSGYDASATMAQLIFDGSPDRESFERVVGGMLRPGAQSGRPVRVYGEMVALLWDAGQVGGAIELEDLWNELGRDLDFSLLCAYPLASLADPSLATSVEKVCKAHSEVVGTGLVPPGRVQPEPTRLFEDASPAVREARRFVVETLLTWGCVDLADDAALVVTELATNALLHARSGFTVTITALQPGVRISVRDKSGLLPARRQAAQTAPSGRGLSLVESIASDWGARPLPDGKVIWADLRPAG